MDQSSADRDKSADVAARTNDLGWPCSSCQAPVIALSNARTGERRILDAEPSPDGTCMLTRRDGESKPGGFLVMEGDVLYVLRKPSINGAHRIHRCPVAEMESPTPEVRDKSADSPAPPWLTELAMKAADADWEVIATRWTWDAVIDNLQETCAPDLPELVLVGIEAATPARVAALCRVVQAACVLAGRRTEAGLQAGDEHIEVRYALADAIAALRATS